MLELIQKRRSCRNFTDKKLTHDQTEQLLKSALWSPTSKNNRPWEFVVVEKTETLDALSQCKPHGAAFLSGAPLGIVVLGDPAKSDVWVEDCSIAAIMMQMTAESMGLGSTWIQVRLRLDEEGNMAGENVKKIIHAPDELEVLGIMAFGHKAKEREPYTEHVLLWDRIHFEKF
ncbi:nitroreductase family protein [Marinilabilia salmonicolor]|jgi:nitroreductase|uniref:Nitroreductase n=1 Tax=Marinilabilia salmonicolor TaxID=989 RepID=A0A2T0XM95_9BACT|nr:nitroreductase family protein [Marinilabilia salmonicolor]PRZ00053.1 nitroreductase [Marinilabilia salmonicolor]RCW38650.1 nitroreductase [Marinilabilia salmonicolor]